MLFRSVVMDLATKIFKTVLPVFMYFVPGLSIIEKQVDFASKKWGVEVLHVPHWILFRCFKNGVYCLPSIKNRDNIPDVKIRDIYNHVIRTSGIPFIATGAKLADSVWRKQNMRSTEGWTDILNPLKNWNKFDVLYYLKKNDIPIPDSSGASATGVDLSTPSILWLYDKHQEDYEKVSRYFPFIGAVVKRRELYGEEGKKTKPVREV